MGNKGFALVLVFVVLVALSGLLFAFLELVSGEMRSVDAGLKKIQAFYISEAGRAKARWALTTDAQAVGWSETNTDPFGTGVGEYTVTTEYSDAPTNTLITITSSGYTPDSTNPLAQRQVVESAISVVTALGNNLSLDLTPGDISASSETVQNPAWKVTDGDTGTKWKAGVKGDAWLKLDFGVGGPPFDRVVINGQAKIASVTIEHSANDSAYSAVTGLVESPTWTFTFDEVSDRYLRVNITATGPNATPDIDELETYNITEGSLSRGEFSTSW